MVFLRLYRGHGQFQSTLLRKERRWSPGDSGSKRSFNPRSYERSDFGERLNNTTHAVSIHAPTKGATTNIMFSCGTISGFNPRSYERSDLELYPMYMYLEQFQSTLLRKERPNSPCLVLLLLTSFNPRSYERSDEERCEARKEK